MNEKFIIVFFANAEHPNDLFVLRAEHEARLTYQESEATQFNTSMDAMCYQINNHLIGGIIMRKNGRGIK